MDTYVRKTPILWLHAWQQLICFAEYFTSTINVKETCIYLAFRMFLQVYSRWETVVSDSRIKESHIYHVSSSARKSKDVGTLDKLRHKWQRLRYTLRQPVPPDNRGALSRA